MNLRDELGCTHSWQNSEGEPACCPDCLEDEVKRLRERERQLLAENRAIHQLLGRAHQRGDYWTEQAGELQAEVDRLNRVIANHVTVGNSIMQAVRGQHGPLSDSDVIGEVERMRAENELLKSQRDRLLEYAVWWWQQRDAATKESANLSALIERHIRLCYADPDGEIGRARYAMLLDGIAEEFDRLRDWSAHHVMDGDIGAAAAECQRLRSIVDRLPKTADGAPIVPGDSVFSVSHDKNTVYDWLVDEFERVNLLNPNDNMRYKNEPIYSIYATREAAEKARQSDAT